MNIKQIFLGISDQIKIDYDCISKNIPHLAQRGEGREEILIKLLEEYLPGRFGVDSGFIFDVHGNVSKQTDLIIYDKFIAPRFKIAGQKYAYPCESVVAAGEVKTFLGAEELRDSVEKMVCVRKLDRTGAGNNRVRMGYHYKMNNEKLNPQLHNCDSIWTFIFSSDSQLLPTLADGFIKNCSEHERHLWPNIICVLNKGIVSYATSSGLSTDPREANSVYSSNESEKDHALIKWFMLLCNDICNNHITAIDAISYFKSGTTQNTKHPIPEGC